jgi:WD40 repeat protein
MNAVVTGGLDGSIRMLDFETSKIQSVGRHGMQSSDGKVACSCLTALSNPSSTSTSTPLIASAGWDSQFHLWDLRQQTPVSTVKLPGKAFSMDFDPVNGRVVVATSGRRTCFFDVRQPASTVLDSMVLERESSLKYQTRCVRFFPDGNAIAVGSVEGRVAVEFLDELGLPTGGKKKYAFKCHRSGDLVYPVNCIEFHPRYGTFATGGCDGSVGKSSTV